MRLLGLAWINHEAVKKTWLQNQWLLRCMYRGRYKCVLQTPMHNYGLHRLINISNLSWWTKDFSLMISTRWEKKWIWLFAQCEYQTDWKLNRACGCGQQRQHMHTNVLHGRGSAFFLSFFFQCVTSRLTKSVHLRMHHRNKETWDKFAWWPGNTMCFSSTYGQRPNDIEVKCTKNKCI